MVTKSDKSSSGCCCGNSLYCGIILILIGGYFLAKDLGWINSSLSIWPILFILFGILIINSNKKKC